MKVIVINQRQKQKVFMQWSYNIVLQKRCVKMRTRIIYYKVAVSPEEEQDFIRAMENLAIIYDKDYEEIIYENGFEEEE